MDLILFFQINFILRYLILLDKKQQFEPKLQSRKLNDGSMVSPELHDMAPFLSREELEQNNIKD